MELVWCVYLQIDLNGLGAGGPSGSAWNILSDNTEASVSLTRAAIILSENIVIQS